MNFLIITLALLISQSIAIEEEEKIITSREAVTRFANLTSDSIEDLPNVPTLVLRDALYDSELVKADKSHEVRFDRSLSSDVNVDESLIKTAEETVEVKSAPEEDVSKSGDNTSVEKSPKTEDATAAFLRDGDDLEKTEEVNISKRADDDENMERAHTQDESEKTVKGASESAERSDQYGEVEKDGSKVFKSRRTLDDDVLDFKARSGHEEENQSDNVRSALPLLDDMKLLQNLNPLDSRNTFSQLNPVVNKQLFRSFPTVPPPQLFKLSTQERPAAFQNYMPSKSPFNVSPELGNQFNRFGILSSKERVQNAYPFQPFLSTTQRSLPNMPLTNFPPNVNDLYSKFAKPTDAFSNFNSDFPQRSLFLNQQFVPLPLLQRFPRFIPIENRIRSYN